MQSYSFLQSALLQANALDSLTLKESGYALTAFNSIQLQRLMAIFLEVFELQYGELFQLTEQGEYRSLLPDDGDFSSDDELWNHFNTVTASFSPRMLPYPAIQRLFHPSPTDENLNFISFPLRLNKEPLGVLILGGRSNGVPYAFQGMDDRVIKNMIHIISLGLNRIKHGADLVDSSGQTLNYLIYSIFNHDAYTSKHSNTTAIRAGKIAQMMGCSEHEIQILKWSAILHDIGKMVVPAKVLNKPSPLNLTEWKIMRLHPEIGSLIIALTTGLSAIAEIVFTHHEHYDGQGYPLGQKGEEIPLLSRILSVVDAYGAMTEHRAYQVAKSSLQAQQELLKCAGTHFDPNIVDQFLNILNTGRLISENIA